MARRSAAHLTASLHALPADHFLCWRSNFPAQRSIWSCTCFNIFLLPTPQKFSVNGIQGESMSQQSELRIMLKDPQLDVRVEAVRAIGRLETLTPDLVGEVVLACAGQPEVREEAFAVLEDLGLPPAESAPCLIKLLLHEDSLVIYWAVTLLGRLGKKTHEIERSIVNVLKCSSEASVQERALWALGKMQPVRISTRKIVEVYSDSVNPRIRRFASRLLAESST